ncbi:MAG: polyphenol oxidase family protein [Candidatus Pacebacteria bacterium]|nr:polyphenol oxidase family protein [Candidatus Paceibacterota bacterium]
MEIFKSTKKGLILAISSKKDGNMRILANQKRFAKKLGFQYLKTNEQVHKDKIVKVNLKSKRTKADGLFTNDKRIALGITVADCLPVFIYNNQEFALIHCGWRGLSLNILNKIKINNSKVLIGPGILKCHFKVKKDVQEIFSSKINHIDLQAIAEKQLILSGVKKKNIKKVRECTFCSNKYFSYRRGDKQAMLAIIGYKS